MSRRYGIRTSSFRATFGNRGNPGSSFSRRRNKGNYQLRAAILTARRPSANAKATRALTLIRKFKKEEEKKLIDTTIAMTTLAAGVPAYQGLVYCAQGQTKTTRIGNKISLDSLAIRGNIICNSLEALGCEIRMFVILDRRPGTGAGGIGAQAVMTDWCTVDNTRSLYTTAENHAGRFQILYDKNFTLNKDTRQIVPFKLYVPLNGKTVGYTLTAGNVTDLQKNNIFFCAVTYSNDENMQVNAYSRIRFTDA